MGAIELPVKEILENFGLEFCTSIVYWDRLLLLLFFFLLFLPSFLLLFLILSLPLLLVNL